MNKAGRVLSLPCLRWERPLLFSQPQPAFIKFIGVGVYIMTFLMNYRFHLKIDPLFWLKTEKMHFCL